jgi:site-specific DNA-methyltransferase (adenine-specific)
MAWTSFQLIKVKFLYIGMEDTAKYEKDKIKYTQLKNQLKLYDWILHKYAKPNDLILDTHLGSGSSRIAAYKGGFNFVGFEIDQEYYEKQEKRFNDFKSQLRLF